MTGVATCGVGSVSAVGPAAESGRATFTPAMLIRSNVSMVPTVKQMMLKANEIAYRIVTALAA
jgi:hypothetical protein